MIPGYRKERTYVNEPDDRTISCSLFRSCPKIEPPLAHRFSHGPCVGLNEESFLLVESYHDPALGCVRERYMSIGDQDGVYVFDRRGDWACMALARRYATSSPSSLLQLKREAEQRALAHAKAGGACVEVLTSQVLDPDRVEVELVLRTDDPGMSFGEALRRFLYKVSTAELVLLEA